MNALEIHGLTKKRGEFALQGLELTLPAGCIMGLIGENGQVHHHTADPEQPGPGRRDGRRIRKG